MCIHWRKQQHAYSLEETATCVFIGGNKIGSWRILGLWCWVTYKKNSSLFTNWQLNLTDYTFYYEEKVCFFLRVRIYKPWATFHVCFLLLQPMHGTLKRKLWRFRKIIPLTRGSWFANIGMQHVSLNRSFLLKMLLIVTRESWFANIGIQHVSLNRSFLLKRLVIVMRGSWFANIGMQHVSLNRSFLLKMQLIVTRGSWFANIGMQHVSLNRRLLLKMLVIRTAACNWNLIYHITYSYILTIYLLNII